MEMLFVTCGTHLEDWLMQELSELHILDLKKGFRGVFAPKTLSNVYRINMFSTIATRVLWPLLQFHCQDKEELYQKVRAFPWHRWIKVSDTFAIDANVHHKNFRNSLYASQVVKDAICDEIKAKMGKRPSIDLNSPSIQLNLFLNEKTCLLSFDTSLDPLFKRGYRVDTVEAPLQESLAAAILKMAGYQEGDILCDPFCGSGTIVIEAALQQTRTPPGLYRKKFGFEKMPMFDRAQFEKIKQEAPARRELKSPILANDKDSKAIAITKLNLQSVQFSHNIFISNKDIAGFFPDIKPTLVITNPPYGLRLSLTQELYQDLAFFLLKRCAPQVRGFILSTTLDLIKATPLQIVSTRKLVNGGVDVELVEVKNPTA